MLTAWKNINYKYCDIGNSKFECRVHGEYILACFCLNYMNTTSLILNKYKLVYFLGFASWLKAEKLEVENNAVSYHFLFVYWIYKLILPYGFLMMVYDHIK